MISNVQNVPQRAIVLVVTLTRGKTKNNTSTIYSKAPHPLHYVRPLQKKYERKEYSNTFQLTFASPKKFGFPPAKNLWIPRLTPLRVVASAVGSKWVLVNGARGIAWNIAWYGMVDCGLGNFNKGAA